LQVWKRKPHHAPELVELPEIAKRANVIVETIIRRWNVHRAAIGDCASAGDCVAVETFVVNCLSNVRHSLMNRKSHANPREHRACV